MIFLSDKKYVLSKMDSNVPYNYFPISQILNTEGMQISRNQVLIWRKKTLEKLIKEAENHNCIDLDIYWKTNVTDFDSNINYFARSIKLAPIAHTIEFFVTNSKYSERQCSGIKEVGWGIKRDTFINYALNGIIPKTEKIIRNSNLYGIGKFEERIVSVPSANGDKNRKIHIKKNAIYQRWSDWCKIKNIKMADAVMDAINDQVDLNPVDGLPDLIQYYKPTEDYESKVYSKSETRKIIFDLDSDIYNMIINYIRLYNDAPENISKPKLNIKKVLNIALKKLIVELELKWKSPELYKEIKQQKIEEEYFEKVIRNGGKKDA